MSINPDSFLDMVGLTPGQVKWASGMVDISSCDQCLPLSENSFQVERVLGDQRVEPIVALDKNGQRLILDGNHRVGAALRRGVLSLYGCLGSIEHSESG